MKTRVSKRIGVTVALAAVAALAALTAASVPFVSAEDAEETDVAISTFHVKGMTCGGCEVGVRRVVKKLEGVEDVEASHKEGTAVVTYQPGTVTPEQIIEAIETLGYSAELPAEEGEGA